MKSKVHQELCLNLCWKQTQRRWCGTLWPVVHTRPRLALNLFVRELSKRHDSCECTISSLLERAPPCHVQKAGWSARLLLFCWVFLPILGCFWETDWLLQQDVQVWYALFGFSSFWPWKLVALNITGQCHHRQLPRPTRAKPHLPDVYIDIYIKREKYLWIYFFPTLWWELLIRNNSLFGGTLPCYSEVCIFLEVDYEYW